LAFLLFLCCQFSDFPYALLLFLLICDDLVSGAHLLISGVDLCATALSFCGPFSVGPLLQHGALPCTCVWIFLMRPFSPIEDALLFLFFRTSPLSRVDGLFILESVSVWKRRSSTKTSFPTTCFCAEFIDYSGLFLSCGPSFATAYKMYARPLSPEPPRPRWHRFLSDLAPARSPRCLPFASVTALMTRLPPGIPFRPPPRYGRCADAEIGIRQPLALIFFPHGPLSDVLQSNWVCQPLLHLGLRSFFFLVDSG